MDIEEIRQSGLLELYVLGQLSPAEIAEVDSYLLQYPDLRNELLDIEKSLEVFARSAAIQPPAGLKEKIMHSIRNTGTIRDTGTTAAMHTKTGSGLWPALAAMFGLGLLLLGYLFYQKDQESINYQQQITMLRDTCAENSALLTEQLNVLKQLTSPGNKILPFAPTPGFAQTDIYLHHNVSTRKLFIQVSHLPEIADAHTFQLWSIKANQPPSPLNTFDTPDDGLVEVQFVPGTEVYAITIEPEGGSETPTMDNLIGTASVAGIN